MKVDACKCIMHFRYLWLIILLCSNLFVSFLNFYLNLRCMKIKTCISSITVLATGPHKEIHIITIIIIILLTAIDVYCKIRVSKNCHHTLHTHLLVSLFLYSVLLLCQSRRWKKLNFHLDLRKQLISRITAMYCACTRLVRYM